jgi:hypothetical protein
MSEEVKALKVVLKNREGTPVLPMIETTDTVAVGSSTPVTAGGVYTFLETWKPNGATGGGVGRQIGDLFHHIDGTPPPGTFALDGAIIENCQTKYPQFWTWLNDPARALVATQDAYDTLLAANGVCLKFVVNGSNVKLPTWTPGIPVTGKLKVKGTGKTLCLTDGSANYAVYEENEGGKSLNVDKSIYDVAVGVTPGTKNNANNLKALGVTTDADKSGMVVAGAPTSGCGIYCIHVYDEVTPSSTLDADAFTANVERLIAEMRLHADVNLTNVTGTADFVVEYKTGSGVVTKDGSTTTYPATWWYRKYRSGWVEQGGCIPKTGVSNSFWAVIEFPVALSDTSYFPCVQHTSTNDANGVNGPSTRDFSCKGLSPVGMAVRAFVSDKEGTYWKVEGMAAEKPQWGTVNVG